MPSVNLNSVPAQKAPEQLSDRLGDSGAQLQSYAERRHQKKESNLSKAKQSELEQREKIQSIQSESHHSSVQQIQDSTIEVAARRSRYDEPRYPENQYHDSTYSDEKDEELPLEEIKQVHTPRK